MKTIIPIEDLLDLLSDAEVERLERRAWTTAAASWSRYWESLKREDPLETSNLLNSAAWEAEHYWRTLHDESRSRRPVQP